MPIAIFHHHAPYGIQFTKRLVYEYGWEAVYISTVPEIYEECKKIFPHAVLHDFYDANKCIPPKELSNLELDPIDTEWLNEFAVHESICMNMMERNDPWGNFQYKDRLKLYHDLIRFWSTFIRKYQPDYFIVEEEPHQIYDYVLSMVAKKMGAKTIMFIRLPFWRMYPVFDFREGAKNIIDCYKNKVLSYKGDGIKLLKNTEDFLSKIQSEFNVDSNLYDQIDALKNLKKNKTFIFRVINLITITIKILNITKFPKRIRFILSLGKPANEQELKAKSGNYRNTIRTNFEQQRMLFHTLGLKKKAKKYYDLLTQKTPDLNTPYILFALNYQPERTTSPQGDHFVNQLLAIDLIAKNLPLGWKLYVKEHPSQFIFSYAGEPYRNKQYYDDILSIKNVEFVPLFTNNYELIDKSKAVATITGTMALEAAIRGKQGIIFGHVWFKGCEGINFIESSKTMKDVIYKIEQELKPETYKIKLFMQSLEENSYPGFVGGVQDEKYSGISQEENTDSHLKAILDLIQDEKL